MQSIKSCHLKPEGRFNIGIKSKNSRNKEQINRIDGIISGLIAVFSLSLLQKKNQFQAFS